MIPLKDLLPTRRTPWVTWGLILVNVAVFLWMQTRGTQVWDVVGTTDGIRVGGFESTVLQYGFVPCELAHTCTADVLHGATVDGGGVVDIAIPHEPVLLTLVTAMFLHGGWLHIAGNMLFLQVFGNNVEDVLGRVRYLLFYLAGGVVADLAQLLADRRSDIPNVGASGAIAAVLGAYVVLFPRARVLCWLIIPWRFPAWVPLLAWFALQVWSGATASVGDLAGGDGVAYWAHIGGFAAGALLIRRVTRERRRWDGRTYVWT